MKNRRHRGHFVTATQQEYRGEFGPVFQIEPSIGISRFIGGPYQDRAFLDIRIDVYRRTRQWHWNLRLIAP